MSQSQKALPKPALDFNDPPRRVIYMMLNTNYNNHPYRNMHAMMEALEHSPETTEFTQVEPAVVEEQYPDLPAVEKEIPSIEMTDAVTTGITLSRDGTGFDEMSPEGGVLVGFRVTKNRRQLTSMQPIYQHDGVYTLGKIYGKESRDEIAQFIAEPGHGFARSHRSVKLGIDAGTFFQHHHVPTRERELRRNHSSRCTGTDHDSIAVERERRLSVAGALVRHFLLPPVKPISAAESGCS